jgi:hypothetical protein
MAGGPTNWGSITGRGKRSSTKRAQGRWDPSSAYPIVTGTVGPIQCIPKCYGERWGPSRAYLIVTGGSGTHTVHTEILPGLLGSIQCIPHCYRDPGTHTVHADMLPEALGPIQGIPNCYRGLQDPYSA